jgi:centrin-1
MALKPSFVAMLSLSRGKKYLKNLGLEAKSDEIQSFFGGNREDSSVVESLDQASFLSFAASKAIQTEKAHKAFDLIDQDGRGIIVLQDLQRVAQELGEDMATEELEEMIQLADRSGDGLLTAQDFVRISRKVNL